MVSVYNGGKSSTVYLGTKTTVGVLCLHTGFYKGTLVSFMEVGRALSCGFGAGVGTGWTTVLGIIGLPSGLFNCPSTLHILGSHSNLQHVPHHSYYSTGVLCLQARVQD